MKNIDVKSNDTSKIVNRYSKNIGREISIFINIDVLLVNNANNAIKKIDKLKFITIYFNILKHNVYMKNKHKYVHVYLNYTFEIKERKENSKH